MATLYGYEYNNAYVAVPRVAVAPGDVSGSVRFMYFKYVLSASNIPTAADIIKLGKLPKGAKVVEACLSFPDLGSTGTLELGWAASADLDSSGSAVEAAVSNGFLAAVDVNTAADTVCMTVNGANASGMLKDFAAEVDVQITVTTTWTATSGTLNGYIAYVVI